MINDSIIIFDPIYGNITFSNIAYKIINKSEFQRLRYIKQLGTCDLVFPSATHSRFEHSLGTYYIVDIYLKNILKNSLLNELEEPLKNIVELNRYYDIESQHYNLENIFELIKIAGLCHDIGHGPYSHLFDSFLESKIDSIIKNHEYRSEIIIEKIILEDDILKSLLLDTDIKFIKNLINPNNTHKDYIYQIISNIKNGIDVDKFDYLTRDSYNLGVDLGFKYNDLINEVSVINNNICFNHTKIDNIILMYEARKKLHKRYLCNPTVLASQFLLTEILEEINKEINLVERISNIDFFIKLTDDFIINFVNNAYIFNYKLENKYLIELNKKFSERKFNKHSKIIYSTNKLNSIDINHNEYIYRTQLGYINHKNNPLNNIEFYKIVDKIPNIIKNNEIYDYEHITYVNIYYIK